MCLFSYAHAQLPAPNCVVFLDRRLHTNTLAPERTSWMNKTGKAVNSKSNGRNRKKIAFGWYGGKFSHLGWLLPLLPKTQQFCEPFGGSASVLINREPSPVETFNDLDGDITVFFRVLRETPDELIRLIALTPFSREEFVLSIDAHKDLSDLERARLFFVRARQARSGIAQKATPGRWAFCRLDSRAGMATVISKWLGSVEGLPEIAQRFLRVQIENGPAIDIINRYDSEETLFYCDPPYPHSSRNDPSCYSYEMTDNDHEELALVLHSVKGKVAISGYHCNLMDELYGDWYVTEARRKKVHSYKAIRQEVLWTNYRPM